MTETRPFISQSIYGRLWHISGGEDSGQTVWLCGARTAHPSPARTPLKPTDVLEGLAEGRMCAACMRRHNSRAEALHTQARRIATQLSTLTSLAAEEAFGTQRLVIDGGAEERAFALAEMARDLGCGDLLERSLSDDPPSEVLR
ncbi:MAG: hypothetical protein GEU71_04675 [Actinobacteria bacterium]|nr:hypothetical protein [Actinomycetota bacterium]